MATGYSVRIYYNEIRGLFRSNGPGGRWIYKVSVAMINEARAEAPSRTGGLKRAHRITRGRGANQYAATFHIENTAEHADWVHGGTAQNGTGWIYPHGDFLLVPSRRGAKTKTRRARVHGQRENPWLDRACTRVAIRYGGVPVG